MAMMMVTSPLTEDDPGETAFIDTFILILLYRPGHEVGRVTSQHCTWGVAPPVTPAGGGPGV
jgi:hypothetical protein